jgi:hypothetical protein
VSTPQPADIAWELVPYRFLDLNKLYVDWIYPVDEYELTSDLWIDQRELSSDDRGPDVGQLPLAILASLDSLCRR